MTQTDRERYRPGTVHNVAGKGLREVWVARFDDSGRCTEWTDTLGDTHRPWFIMEGK